MPPRVAKEAVSSIPEFPSQGGVLASPCGAPMSKLCTGRTKNKQAECPKGSPKKAQKGTKLWSKAVSSIPEFPSQGGVLAFPCGAPMSKCCTGRTKNKQAECPQRVAKEAVSSIPEFPSQGGVLAFPCGAPMSK